MPPAHTFQKDSLERVFAYRSLNLRDIFLQPLENFRKALECLPSDKYYLADMSGEIIAYLWDGGAVHIHEYFFVLQNGNISAVVLPQENDYVCAAVEALLREALLKTSTTLEEASTFKPFQLNILLKPCDSNDPELDYIQTWQHIGDQGRVIIEASCTEDAWNAAVKAMDEVQARRWMKTAHLLLEDKSSSLCIEEDLSRVYELVLQMDNTRAS